MKEKVDHELKKLISGLFSMKTFQASFELTMKVFVNNFLMVELEHSKYIISYRVHLFSVKIS